MILIDELLRRTTARIAARRRPESTYRLQFHAGFTFRHATDIVGYLRDLGVTHCYASPYLKAAKGSTHGYDVIDHSALNPEVGSEEDYAAWIAALAGHGLSHILDTVPNHVGIASNDNSWWNDVLENGPSSRYGSFFDVAWRGSPRPELHDRILLPFLGSPFARVLEKGELRLAFDSTAGTFAVWYYDRRFPISPFSYGRVLRKPLDELRRRLGREDYALMEYESILTAVAHLSPYWDSAPALAEERSREKQVIKRRLAKLAADCPPVRQTVEEAVAGFNGTPGEPRSFDALDELLSRQCYRLAYWRNAPDEINYRRFFDINELAALRMDREKVFAAAHEFILRLLAEGKVTGLRIDHPDGLLDPEQYFQRLQLYYAVACARSEHGADPIFSELEWPDARAAVIERLEPQLRSEGKRPLYVVAEKILAADEALPPHWAVDGASGYDFLSHLNGLYVDAANEDAFTRLYHEVTHDPTRFQELAYQKKRLILDSALASELHMLARQLDRLAQRSRRSRDFTLGGLLHALREVISCFPVYRSYVTGRGLSDTDRRYINAAIESAVRRNPQTDPTVFDFIRDTLICDDSLRSSGEDEAARRQFAGKFQQVTAPVTAKGIEDTAFYLYHRLASLNEVGGDPGRFGTPPEELHRYLLDRQAQWPYALSALSTHDTKRSEDVRARINVLSEIPGEWRERVLRWGRMNEPHRLQAGGQTVPGPNEEYLLYQTLIGAWPLEGIEGGGRADFVKRIQAYMRKAMREAKRFTSWTDPNAEYEAAVETFVARILDEPSAGPFLTDFRPFQRRISHFGLLNSLSQTLIRLTAPGVPDTYQGTEAWDFSLVDPDNRRPVDYSLRRRTLSDLRTRCEAVGEDRGDFAAELFGAKEDGRVKLWLTWAALAARRDHPGLFSAGEYVPVEATGEKREHVFAFIRRSGDHWALVAAPRLLARMSAERAAPPLGPDAWGDTRLILPKLGAGGVAVRNSFTGERIGCDCADGQHALSLGAAFARVPFALFTAES